MSYATNKRQSAGIYYVSDMNTITVSSTTTPSNAISIPEEATHFYCMSFTSGHTVKFGTSSGMSAPTAQEDGWYVTATNAYPRLIPLDPTWTHFRVRTIANNTANRFSYAFLSIDKGVTVEL